jgi:hypothetical protein
MINEVRDSSGKFAPKSEVPRKVRSVNLTDNAWHWLATVTEKAGVSRNDYLEALASSNQPFIQQPAVYGNGRKSISSIYRNGTD